MARTASKHVKVAGGLIVAPKGKRMNAIPGLQIHYAAHPIPDRCSTTAARAAIKYLEQIDPKEHVLFFNIRGWLISSLFTAKIHKIR